MRFTNLTNAVASRYVHPISARNGNNRGENKRKLSFSSSAQAREEPFLERSLSLPQKPLTDFNPLKLLSSSSPTRTATDASPLDNEGKNTTSPLVWQRLPRQDALVLLSATTLGFSFLASDLVVWHNLRWLDTGIHLYIRDHTSLELQNFARHAMSNTPIVLGWCGWIAAAAVLLYTTSSKNKNKMTVDENFHFQESTQRAVRHLCISVAMYLVGGGTILHGDPWLVSFIKGIFHRTRPSELSSTYAFPSGHTTSAAFVIGALVCIILPAVLDTLRNQEESSTNSTLLENVESIALQKLQENKILIWILCVATTASGRVIADVHWSTDVMAGACLGTGLVALAVLACEVSDVLISGKDRRE